MYKISTMYEITHNNKGPSGIQHLAVVVGDSPRKIWPFVETGL